MTSEVGSQSRTQASWPTDVSHLFLECLIKQHKSGRSGDNGLKKERWVDISKTIKECCKMTYEVEQLRNHYRVWKARIKALSDLQKQCGLGWNSVDNRFDAPQHVWNEFKVMHIFLCMIQFSEVIIYFWMGNEIATGHGSFHPFDSLHDDNIDSVPVDGLDNMDFDVYEDSQAQPNTSGIPVGSSNRSGRRPRSDATSVDFNKKCAAKRFFLDNKTLANILMEANEEERMTILDMYLPI
ncbi:uncharacterized protein LOC122644974 [Telopea speciosissima]|uniref:uncharacterized protein LOC122644974 n=1 Tax=Telopea speciosissima TaxID=54955 RepID=UPI001CC7F420|nr:uncharacterized protein LOC122644974 [Telopea speciosissima]